MTTPHLPFLSIDPASRRVSLDGRNPDFYRDPNPVYAALHAHCPTFWWEEQKRWFFTGYDHVNGLLRDRRFGRQILHVATREELGGSTITLTSLGKLGGIVSTPIINLPEVAIVGVNRAAERPVVENGQVVVRRMMNLSSSFDHRFVDGYDGAAMIQALKQMLEQPATIFLMD